ncbi:ribosomal protein S18-alanine N-acetyltransferase [Fructobacillus fructosus]|uniref:ribosomal protein S18-alanine N-acetyltransferase n=1 Tax=Fructobacillus fructosus TaxID=1631 RepID=UPI0030C81D92
MRARLATVLDAPMIATLFHNAFGGHSPIPEAVIVQQLQSHRVHYLMEEHGRAVLSFTVVLDEVEIDYLAVLPDNQRQGLGQALLGHLLEQQAGNRILLEVAANNQPAQKLYAKMGFQTYNEWKNYYQDGQTAILMEKRS